MSAQENIGTQQETPKLSDQEIRGGFENINLKTNQINQILEQYRLNIYNLELRVGLLVKMLEEKNMFAPGEFDKRWPIYLKNDIGVQGTDGIMDGLLKVTFYGTN